MSFALHKGVRTQETGLPSRLADELRVRSYCLLQGEEVAGLCGITKQLWEGFSSHWERLEPDRFMNDGGKYRLRRYGQFEATFGGEQVQLPHGPYEQPLYINALNGGIARQFEPLEGSFAQHRVLNRTIQMLMSLFDASEGSKNRWNIKLHPYRILANPEDPGQPTPEGLHRDGVSYVAVMMVGRKNIVGGETTLTDAQGAVLARLTLTDPMQILIANDDATMHQVSCIRPSTDQSGGWRDVLVLAFTKIPHA